MPNHTDVFLLDGRGREGPAGDVPSPPAPAMEGIMSAGDSLPADAPPPPAAAAAAPVAGGMYNILCGGFSRNGTHYVIGGSDNIVRIWNLESLLLGDREPPDVLRGHTGSITSVSFAHTQDAILSGSMDGT